MEALYVILSLILTDGSNYNYKQENSGQHYSTVERVRGRPENCGIASWYGQELAGRSTANGEPFNPNGLTAASWYHRFGSRVKVYNPENGRTVVVRINDRGPNKRLGRIIDLSKAAFRKIGRLSKGVVVVCLSKER